MSKINPNIPGYEVVKNCTTIVGYERCGYTHLFAFQKPLGNLDGDASFEDLVEVMPIKGRDGKEDSYKVYCEFRKKYPIENYWVVGGSVGYFPWEPNELCLYLS